MSYNKFSFALSASSCTQPEEDSVLSLIQKETTFGQKCRALSHHYKKLNPPPTHTHAYTSPSLERFELATPPQVCVIPTSFHPCDYRKITVKILGFFLGVHSSGCFTLLPAFSKFLRSILHFTLPSWTLLAPSILAFGLTTESMRSSTM